MAISAFPLALQAIIQQNMLEREFLEGLQPNFTFRDIADRETFATNVGETVTKTRKGLKAPVTTPMNPAQNTNLDNGLTPSGWAVEQYTLGINMYGDTTDLNVVTQQVGIADQFLANAKTNGVQAAQSVNRLARNALYGTYLGGNTRVAATLGSAGNVVAVDDVTGFTWATHNGVQLPVSGANPLLVTIGADVYNVVGFGYDTINTSTAPFGKSGSLTLDSNVSVSDGTVGQAVVASVAPVVIRAGGHATTDELTATDKLTMKDVQAAVAELRSNNVQPGADGFYSCKLDPRQMQGLYRDPEFQLLYRGAYGSDAYESGAVAKLTGVKFVETTEAPQQTLSSKVKVHRAIVCGQGALVEGVFAGTGAAELAGLEKGQVTVADGIASVTREPLDRLQQIVAQSWYYIGGFAVPTDLTASASIIPTASNSAYKRAVVIEST